ncbi:hypothetical protein SERLA73DRAFT_185630 [Serpula lacrymans var. lacrymans S7.3]|uniref:Uncharacterized protein n=1 Tax=Serpula lacrymans var. lacrymans (strain S7.3) TaxID=936435 RepID=F8Q655_SERL3|nr:hypothetical protein SERLA73DRAFT_185630 [Serpula lacrymans var. lacrymans S7.3]
MRRHACPAHEQCFRLLCHSVSALCVTACQQIYGAYCIWILSPKDERHESERQSSPAEYAAPRNSGKQKTYELHRHEGRRLSVALCHSHIARYLDSQDPCCS